VAMAKTNSFEKKMLNQINDLNEGIITKIVKMLFKKTVDRTMKKMIKNMKDDPELQAAMADYQKQRERTKDIFDKHCKENPKSAFCK
jgi:predicted ATP-grasp superfamily ATP-dependent carboligase